MQLSNYLTYKRGNKEERVGGLPSEGSRTEIEATPVVPLEKGGVPKT
jgi:hypothetical protein